MTDFPRGWTLTNLSAANVAATITVPAVAGVVHVLDGFTAILENSTATNAGSSITLSSSDGTFTNYPIGYIYASPTAEGQDGDSGLNLAAGPGASLTIAFSATAAGIIEFLRVLGHDI